MYSISYQYKLTTCPSQIFPSYWLRYSLSIRNRPLVAKTLVEKFAFN